MSLVTPSPFTAGTVQISAGTPQNLGQLVTQQVDGNAVTAAFLISMQADANNSTPILFGSDNNVGTGSPVKYGYSLAVGADRQFGGGTGNNVLWGRWYVYSASAAVLHIEIMP